MVKRYFWKKQTNQRQAPIRLFITSAGCDSTVITTLTILPHEETNYEYTICEGSSIQVGTSSYDSEGVYSDTLQNINGCDSIVNSVLFVLPEITASDEATICMGGSLTITEPY